MQYIQSEIILKFDILTQNITIITFEELTFGKRRSNKFFNVALKKYSEICLVIFSDPQSKR